MDLIATVALAPVVQTMDSAIHWINHYPLNSAIEGQMVKSKLQCNRKWHSHGQVWIFSGSFATFQVFF